MDPRLDDRRIWRVLRRKVRDIRATGAVAKVLGLVVRVDDDWPLLVSAEPKPPQQSVPKQHLKNVVVFWRAVVANAERDLQRATNPRIAAVCAARLDCYKAQRDRVEELTAERTS